LIEFNANQESSILFSTIVCPVQVVKLPLLGQVYRKYCLTDAQNGEGVKHVCPCILMVLYKFKVSWHKKIDNIVNDSKLLHDALETLEGL